MSSSENLKIYSKLRELCSRLVTPEQRREAAKRWEVAESTVRRWANGVARPHPRIAQLIVEFLEEKEKRCTICERQCTEGDRMKRWDRDRSDWVEIEPPEYLCGYCEDGCAT